MSLRLSFACAAFAASTCAVAQAGVLSGQLRDTHGAPVSNAALQFDLMSGSGTVFVSGGFTDTNGNFSATVTPDGAYKMTVLPQPPPLSSVVSQQFNGVTIGVTPNDLGTVVLANGARVRGRVVNTAGTPLVSVGVEFKTPSDSQWRSFTNGDTDAAGRFDVNVPFGPCQIGFEPGPVPYYGGPGTGPMSLELDSHGPSDLGDVVMPAGYPVSTSAVRQSDGSPVEDARVEFVHRSTGSVAYTPHNRTGANGALTITVAAGDYDVRFLPVNNDGLLPGVLPHRVVPGTSLLGTIVLQEGVELRGRVRGSDNTGYPEIAVELFDSVTNAPVLVDGGVTNATGNYSIIVAPGTYDVRFTPPFSIPFGVALVSDVVVDSQGSHVTQNGTLPSVPFSTLVGSGVPGLGGIVPRIGSVGGAPRLGNAQYTLDFSEARGAATGVVVYTIRPATVAHGPQLYRKSLLALDGTAGVAGDGTGTFTIPIPNDSALIGQELHAWLLVRDGASVLGYSVTQELRAVIQL
ncbi:MAG: carboxypeptidase regulatory-like domain-containing protein [Planctomycetes bacterium]|nr:carboxypeptidase regulatory-like domain-containing protein [Planctomycetota bacterium]